MSGSEHVANICEHGDHPAPPGMRYCSGDCERCDGALDHTCDRCDPPGFRFLPLSKGLHALVNNTDLREILKHKWQVKLRPRGPAYAVTTIRGADGRRHFVQLHRFVWDLHGGRATPVVDHENGVGLDCRWTNLRAATHVQNAWNASAHKDSKSGVRGVHWDKRRKQWRVRVMREGKRISVYCDEKGDAIAERDFMVREMHGEFAREARCVQADKPTEGDRDHAEEERQEAAG